MEFPKPPARKLPVSKGTPPKLEDANDQNLQRIPPKLEGEKDSVTALEKTKDLNFKVPESFARKFKLRATEKGLSMVEYLKWLVAQSDNNTEK